MHTFTNCTPHVVFLSRDLVADPLFTLRGRGQYTVIHGHKCLALAPSGYTLPALPVVTGPDLAARATYQVTDKLRQELRELRMLAHAENPGADHLLISSMISAEAAQSEPDLLYDGVVTLRCRTPVFADVCARNPPDQRWADRLAMWGGCEEVGGRVENARCDECGQWRAVYGGKPQLHSMGPHSKGMCNR